MYVYMYIYIYIYIYVMGFINQCWDRSYSPYHTNRRQGQAPASLGSGAELATYCVVCFISTLKYTSAVSVDFCRCP